MTSGKQIFHTLSRFISCVADWFLIAAGVLLTFVALWRIDVPLARYVVMCSGLFLTAAGSWYRYRSKKRYR